MSSTAYPTDPILIKIRFWLSFFAGLLGFGYLMVVGGYIWRGDFTVQVIGLILMMITGLAWFIWRAVIWMDPFPRTGLEFGIVFCLLAVLVALLASPDPRQGFARAGWLAGYALIFYFLINLLSSDLDRWGMLAGLVTVVGLVLAQAVAETLTWYQDWFQAAGSLDPAACPVPVLWLIELLDPADGSGQPAGPVVGYSAVRAARPVTRLLAFAWLFIYALAVPFSSSRGGWLGLAVALGVGFAFWAAARRPGQSFQRWPRRRQVVVANRSPAGSRGRGLADPAICDRVRLQPIARRQPVWGQRARDHLDQRAAHLAIIPLVWGRPRPVRVGIFGGPTRHPARLLGSPRPQPVLTGPGRVRRGRAGSLAVLSGISDRRRVALYPTQPAREPSPGPPRCWPAWPGCSPNCVSTSSPPGPR